MFAPNQAQVDEARATRRLDRPTRALALAVFSQAVHDLRAGNATAKLSAERFIFAAFEPWRAHRRLFLACLFDEAQIDGAEQQLQERWRGTRDKR